MLLDPSILAWTALAAAVALSPGPDTLLVAGNSVRLAQPFSMRYPLIDGQGNFGSIDGDPPAAYRYTECRLTRLAERMLADIDKDTVDFVDNFDGSDQEPAVLPAQIPNLLIKGSDGIAVGMATNIPPHNLGEVCDALLKLIENPELTLELAHPLAQGRLRDVKVLAGAPQRAVLDDRPPGPPAREGEYGQPCPMIWFTPIRKCKSASAFISSGVARNTGECSQVNVSEEDTFRWNR